MPTPTRQLLASTSHLTDGTTTIWNFSFSGGYINKGHIKAYYETPAGIRTIITVTEAMVVGAYQLQITPAIASGNTLVIYRDTPKTAPLVDFTDESGLSEIALDTTAKQAVFIGAESFDNTVTGTREAKDAASAAGLDANRAEVAAGAAKVSKDSAFAALTSALSLYGNATALSNAVTAASNSAIAADASAGAALVSEANATASATTVFNANTTAYTRTFLDDANAIAARATLGAVGNTDLNGGQFGGLRNKIINGGFAVNQRGYVSGAIVGASLYAHDRWKTAAPLQYTFSTVDNKTTVTIPDGAGHIQQVIEGINLQSGTYTLSWEGTTFGRVNGGAYSTSGMTVTIVGGVNALIEFSNGTVANVQFELGPVATVFEQRPYGMELALCQRYYEVGSAFPVGYVVSGLNMGALCKFAVPKRVAPTVIQTNTGASNVSTSTSAANGPVATEGYLSYRVGTATGVGQYTEIWTASAEL